MNSNKDLPEHWLRGPVPRIPDLLQPAAHALLQSLDEVKKYTKDFPEHLIHKKPAGRASVAFHLKHITGVLDRMLTYAAQQELNDTQFAYLEQETKPRESDTLSQLITRFEDKVNEALGIFKNINPAKLTEKRSVGRKNLPSTCIDLLFHAAEHSQRHVGQLLVSVSFLKEKAH